MLCSCNFCFTLLSVFISLLCLFGCICVRWSLRFMLWRIGSWSLICVFCTCLLYTSPVAYKLTCLEYMLGKNISNKNKTIVGLPLPESVGPYPKISMQKTKKYSKKRSVQRFWLILPKKSAWARDEGKKNKLRDQLFTD